MPLAYRAARHEAGANGGTRPYAGRMTFRRLRPLIPALLLVLTLAATATGQARNRPDAAAPTGGTDGPTRQFAPDPQVDYQHLKLDLRMPDPKSKSFTATETLTFTTYALPLDSLALDAVGLDVRSVKDGDGHDLDYRYDGKILTVRFEEPLPPRSDHTLVFEYVCSDPADGLNFALPDDAYPDRPLQIHSQGEAQTNRYWLIAHDYPNEKMTTEIAATVPDDLKVLSNGKFLGVADAGVGGDGMKTWHYKLSEPHASYLISLVIGQFDVVEDEWRGKRLAYWVPPGKGVDVERTYRNTKDMLDFFSDKLGEYPWDAYSQSVVYNFGAGGMENTSVTTLYEDAVLSERATVGYDIDGLISHEMAHQWFGDHTTCKTWAELWLNEGFASYLDAAWHEHKYGADEYAVETYGTMKNVAASDDVTADGGLFWPTYSDPEETFRRRVSNPYGKGQSVIHMLREEVGDDAVFWDALKLFQTRYAFKSVEHADLRHCFEELTGRDFSRFFRQWVERPGCPKLDVKYAWDDDAKAVDLTMTQTQPIAVAYPAFEGPMRVWCVMKDGTVRKFTAELTGKESRTSLATGEEPAQVVVNPTNGMLCVLNFTPPAAMTLAQATDGPTAFAKLQAIDRLATSGNSKSRDALVSILTDADTHYGIRSAAAASLGKMDTPEARDALLTVLKDGVADPKVRRAVVSAVGDYKDATVTTALMPLAEHDNSLFVEASALSALGNQRPTDAIIDLLVKKTDDTGWASRVRQAAVGALADAKDKRGIEPAKKLAAYGGPFRARGTGISALGSLYEVADDAGKTDIRESLLAIINDPQGRNATLAIRTLASTGDKEAIPALERLAAGSAPDALKDAATGAVRKINSGGDESSTVQDLRRRLDRLEDERDAAQFEKRQKAIETNQTPDTPTTRAAA